MAKKLKPQKPDEVFSKGPFTMASFGESIVFETNWQEGEFDEYQKHLVKKYPEVIEEIDVLVSEIRDLIKVLPPEQLLLRAWWERTSVCMNIETDEEIGAEELISLRMIDYVQSVIAAVQPAETQRERSSVTDEEWKELRSKVEHLFNELGTTYQTCRTAKNRADDPNLDMNFEEFHFKAQLYWCDVRGKRYPVYQIAYLEELFLPHTAVLQRLFGISGEQFISEINKIWHGLLFGIQDLSDNIEQFRRDTLDAINKKISSLPSNYEPDLPDLRAEVIKENDWEDRINDIFGRLQGMKLFDVQEITILPEKLLEELSWRPGEDKDFFDEGEFCGWPLRIWPIFKRPFIQLGCRYYCFDLNSLFDNLYRVMQRIILRLEPNYKETWNTIQRSQSEDLPFKHLEHLLPSAKVLREVYYRGKTDQGGTNWCETDGLLIYDDHLFIVEARGGAFTYTPPATDFQAYIASLKNLVLKPAMQGRRFLNYLKSAESVPLFDSNHNQIDELRKSDFRHITICAVTLDPFTELAAQIQHLKKIGVNVGVEPIWAISLDDLRIYADIFENPLIFLHYVEQRMQAFRSDIVQYDDELDHLGLYLKHNHYSTYLKELQGNLDARIGLFGYRSEIEKFFHERLLDSNTPCPLKQDIPARLLDIVEFLSRSDKPGRAEIAAYLLNLSGTWRKNLDTCIHEELVRQPVTKRSLPFSVHGGDFNLTVFCWTEHSGPRNTFLALYHAQKLVVMHNEARRFLIELSYAVTGELQDVNWTWVELAGIPSSELPKLRSEANNLRQKRIAQAKTQNRKIGRNAPCPCGSGKKYKKCCLGRNSH